MINPMLYYAVLKTVAAITLLVRCQIWNDFDFLICVKDLLNRAPFKVDHLLDIGILFSLCIV